MFWSLPLGPARLERPKTPFRYTFEHFLELAFLVRSTSPIIPIEAVAVGDVQVLAACEQGKAGMLVIDLDVLAAFPTAESGVVSTRIRASREIPNIRELLFCS